jgi:hypothetical protein
VVRTDATAFMTCPRHTPLDLDDPERVDASAPTHSIGGVARTVICACCSRARRALRDSRTRAQTEDAPLDAYVSLVAGGEEPQ